MDLHHKEIQAFFDCSVDNLRASPFIIQYILDSIPSYQNAVIIAKSPDATRRASSYAERLQLDIAVIHGEVRLCLFEPHPTGSLSLNFMSVKYDACNFGNYTS